MQKTGCVCVGVSKFNSVAAGLFSGLDHWASRAWVIEGGGAFLTPFSFALMDQSPSEEDSLAIWCSCLPRPLQPHESSI